MERFNRPPAWMASGEPEPLPMKRTSQRVTVTLNWSVHRKLLQQSDLQGRSLSNLAAHVLEVGLNHL
jgi:predicted HicB family RNase H-like nuclease